MTRRIFILSIIGIGTGLALLPQYAKTPILLEPFKVIEAVQETLFPKNLKIPSALEFGATNYLLRVSNHSSFDKDDLKFLQYGTHLLIQKNPNFLREAPSIKEQILREFVESSSKAEKWVALLLYYSVEALFSDPIYGGNKNKIGWKSVNHHTGEPRPKVCFGGEI